MVDEGFATVAFQWSDTNDWSSEVNLVVANGTSVETMTLAFAGQALAEHAIYFVVERVEYYDEQGIRQVLENTIENPQDLSGWAYFPQGSVIVTDATGTAAATLYVRDRPEIAAVAIKGYDLTVYDEPNN